jgi:hypothetical protein
VDTLESLGLKVDLVKNIPVGGTSKRCIVFSSIQGLFFLLKKKCWTSAEAMSYEED